MNSSGIKRGLAFSAVSALAVAGLPFLAGSASAVPINNGMGAGTVDLISGDGVAAWETGSDGVDNKVHLVARGAADVQEVLFQYEAPAGTWNDIARVGAANGVFETYWTPAGSLAGGAVNVRALAYDSNNTVLSNDANSKTYNPGSTGIDIAGTPGSQVGIFTQPYAGGRDYAIASGTAASATVRTSAVGFAAPTAADNVGTPDVNGIRSWSGIVDLGAAGAYSTATTPNQLAIKADTGATGSDDVEAFAAYKQTITTVDIAADPITVATGGTSDVTITVKDQNGKPIAGAQVASNGAAHTGTANTGTVVGTTDSLGQVVVSGLNANITGESYRFWVNTTANVDYENGTDFEKTVTVGSYTPAPTTLSVSSTDGDAFDLDEWAGSDVKVKVVDQNGAPMNNQTVRYVWFFTPFQPSATNTAWNTAAAEQTATTGADGTASIAKPSVPGTFPNGGTEGTYTLRAYVNTNGTPGYQDGEPAVSKDLKAGQATAEFDNGSRQQALAGGNTTVTGKLVLADGTPLEGRVINVAWVKGAEEGGLGDAKIAAQADQPAGTNRIDDNNASAQTKAGGVFTVVLTDPAETPQGKELGGVLTSEFTPGNSGTTTHDTITVDFLRSLAPASITQVGGDNELLGDATPGRPVETTYVVRNAQGDLLSDVEVAVSLDHGFITNLDDNGDLVPAQAPVDGDDYGVWKNDGTTATLTSSDAAGTVSVVSAIERDAGFDDDGEQDVTVSLTAGGVSAGDAITFNTLYNDGGAGADEPVNPGAVTISLAAEQESTILPDARIDQEVGYRVEAKDSFGNLIADEVALSDDTADGNIDNAGVLSQFTKDTGASVYAWSYVPGTVQSVTATYTAETTVYWDNPADVATTLTVVNDEATSESTADPIKWYTVDWADPATVLSISSDESGSVPVGTAVHTDVTAIDQKGQPIDDLGVKFVRKGPNDQGGDYNWDGYTGPNGKANYDWVGTDAGTAQVTAFVYDTWGPLSNGDLVKKLTEKEITFGNTPKAIGMKLKGSSKGKKDVLKVNAKSIAAGLQAKVLVKGKVVAKHALNGSGDWTFKVKDKNGKKVTKYTVKVVATASTNSAKKSVKVK